MHVQMKKRGRFTRDATGYTSSTQLVCRGVAVVRKEADIKVQSEACLHACMTASWLM